MSILFEYPILLSRKAVPNTDSQGNCQYAYLYSTLDKTFELLLQPEWAELLLPVLGAGLLLCSWHRRKHVSPSASGHCLMGSPLPPNSSPSSLIVVQKTSCNAIQVGCVQNKAGYKLDMPLSQRLSGL